MDRLLLQDRPLLQGRQTAIVKAHLIFFGLFSIFGIPDCIHLLEELHYNAYEERTILYIAAYDAMHVQEVKGAKHGMEPGFFERFYPRVISVQKRDPAYWEEKQHSVLVRSASIRNFFYIFEGQGHVELDGTRYMLSSGSMFHVSLHTRFQLSSAKDRPLLYYSVHYDYRMIDWDGEAARCLEPQAGLPFEPVMQLQNQDVVVAAMQRLYDVWDGKDTGFEWKSRVAFLNVLCEISEQKRIELGDCQTTQSIIRSMEYIRSHYDEPLKRQELAESVSLSVNHYSFLFKQYSGYSPMQYITRVRLDNAKHMLRNSSLPISEIASRVGFQDPLYFARVFAKETGYSPRAYRKA